MAFSVHFFIILNSFYFRHVFCIHVDYVHSFISLSSISKNFSPFFSLSSSDGFQSNEYVQFEFFFWLGRSHSFLYCKFRCRNVDVNIFFFFFCCYSGKCRPTRDRRSTHANLHDLQTQTHSCTVNRLQLPIGSSPFFIFNIFFFRLRIFRSLFYDILITKIHAKRWNIFIERDMSTKNRTKKKNCSQTNECVQWNIKSFFFEFFISKLLWVICGFVSSPFHSLSLSL